MADIEQPASAPEGKHADLMWSPEPSIAEQQMEQPPPYMQSPPTYTPYPSFDPQIPSSELQYPLEPDPDPCHQHHTEGQLVVGVCGISVLSFEAKSIRRAFIRKVFCLLTLQLLFTFSIVCVFTFSSTVRAYVQTNVWIVLSSYIVYAVVSLCLLLSRSFSRQHPWNLVGLGLVTLSLSYILGTVASNYDTPVVIIAMGSTLATTFAIVIFSAQAKVDFTICSGILVVLSANLLMFGFFSIFYYTNIMLVFYGFLGALVSSLFLVVNCQLVIGNDKYGLHPEEYVYGALVIYLDIMYIFRYILIILGGSRR